MIKKVLFTVAGMAVFLAGAFAEGWFHITPVVTAIFRTIKIFSGDVYSGVLARFPGEIDTTSALVALAGFLALLSFKYLARDRRM